MSRTHAPASYGFRSLCITTFVIAASFFANTVPVLAEFSPQGPTGGSQGMYGNSHSPNPMNQSSSGYGGGGGASNTQNPSMSNGAHEGGDAIAALQARIAQLDAMKAQLQKLLESLKQRNSLPPPQVCPLVARPIGGSPASTSTDLTTHCRPSPSMPLPPLMCGTPQGCHPIWSNWNSTSTNAGKNCVNNDPRRCNDVFGGATSTPVCADCHLQWLSPHATTTANPAPSYGGGSSAGMNSFGSSMTHGSMITSPQPSSPSSGGMVHGASSDMSAEMAEVLAGLQSDLLDIRDALDQ